jgi:hypothetical protein
MLSKTSLTDRLSGSRLDSYRILTDRLSHAGRYRWLVFFRLLVGFIGSYVLTAYITVTMVMIMVRLLPMPRVDAVLLSSMLSYVWYLGVIIWCFSAHSLLKLTGIMILLIVALAAINYGLQTGMAA